MMMAALTLTAVSLSAQPAADKKTEKADSVNPNAPVFTVIKENPITSVKNQARSGTCWNYSTLSYFEAEILKKSKKT